MDISSLVERELNAPWPRTSKQTLLRMGGQGASAPSVQNLAPSGHIGGPTNQRAHSFAATDAEVGPLL